MQALEAGYEQPAVYLGCGGTIGYVGPAARILNCVPILMGITGGNLHSHDEFLDLPDWLRLQKSIVAFLEKLGERQSSLR
jgi:acetylornithine deacetylase/succinyl-diaminopimelate desuccinylase-like protein